MPQAQQQTLTTEFSYAKVAEEIGLKAVNEKKFLILGNKVIEKEICLCSDSTTVDAKIYCKIMSKDIQNHLGIASKIDEGNASELFGAVMKLNICPDNADFVDLIQHKVQSSGI